MPRKSSDFETAARALTDMMGVDDRLYNSTLAMNRKHLSMLCGTKAKESAAKPGSNTKVYDLDDVLEAFPLLKSEMDALGFGCNLLTLLKGSPRRNIDRLIELPEMPPIYESSSYDTFVEKHAKRLGKTGFKYKWASLESQFDRSRLTYDRVKELGLVGE